MNAEPVPVPSSLMPASIAAPGRSAINRSAINAEPLSSLVGGAPLWEARSWLGAQTLETLGEVNEQCLDLICGQACEARPDQPWLWGLRTLLRQLDGASRHRAARCAVLLVDPGFSDTLRWSAAASAGVGVQDRERLAPAAAFFTVADTVPVMRLVLTYAWHLARSENAAARVLLGMSATCVAVFGECTLSRVTRLAETHAHWLRPRWLGQPRVWRDLLQVAAAAEPVSLARMRLRGLPLLAAEARTR